VKCYVRLCRESPFTALPSEAIFAVTDDFLNWVTICAGLRPLLGRTDTRFFFLFFLAQPPARENNPAGKSPGLTGATGRQPHALGLWDGGAVVVTAGAPNKKQRLDWPLPASIGGLRTGQR